jgi:hypothetical protein
VHKQATACVVLAVVLQMCSWLAGYTEDVSKGQNAIHLMRGALFTFQQHNKARYIFVIRFVGYAVTLHVKQYG